MVFLRWLLGGRDVRGCACGGSAKMWRAPNQDTLLASTGSDRRGRAPVRSGSGRRDLVSRRQARLPEVIYRWTTTRSSTRRGSGATDSTFKGGKLRNNNGPPESTGGPQSFARFCQFSDRSSFARSFGRRWLGR